MDFATRLRSFLEIARPGTVSNAAEIGVESRADEPVLLDWLRRRWFVAQLVTMTLLGCLHILYVWAEPGTHLSSMVELFDVDLEMNLPTWFASFQLAIVALTLACITSLVWLQDGRRSKRFWIWTGCTAAALYMSADEVSAIHERLGGSLEYYLAETRPDSPLRALLDFPSYYWVLVYAPIVIPGVLLVGRFAWRELGAARRIAVLGLFVYLYAAVGLDFIEGRFGNVDHTRMSLRVFSQPFLFDIFLMEEMLEMLGVALVGFALLAHLRTILARLLDDSAATR